MINRLITSRSLQSFARCSDTLASRCVGGTGAAALSSTLRPAQLPIINHTNNQLPSSAARHFSDSHDDFSPQKKHSISSDDSESKIMEMIDSHVKSNRIMLYMKGSPNMPMCGFSATVVQILKNSGADFASVNVLDYPEVREGVKKYAQWPTIPQLYVDGEFVGGCDIVKDMDESGELKELLMPAEGGVDEKKED